ncbi:Flagellar protein FlgJ, N-terminal [Syntrophomonas zehnderi OL-4]|uniref:Flagellar protein FlgJ, N-terminal n=1 Tax=Syntrophomonas zehnderi OL-4 TaxID=690567 RepID=A0A0E4GDR1_9FIRM|nr:rod-binding protein [Syntrophomonas zehnderi]CFX56912.1 Flagellar protein FlgJ, N-terminal [Syntrophomonas zehnderi OL-4]
MEIKNSLINIGMGTPYTKPLDKTQSKEFSRTLQAALETSDEKKLYASCQELESIFLSKVLESMRATIPDGGLLKKSFAEETFESMLYDEYAKECSQTGSLGLADIIYKQLSVNLKTTAK